jgi:hypothetical protein
MEAKMKKTIRNQRYILLILCISMNIYTAYAGRIPDTGQTESFTEVFGEDADYKINPPSYQKLDASGNPLPVSANEWVMIKDQVTDLIWEKKTTDGTMQDKDTKYTWANVTTYLQNLNANNFGGYSDWRLPTISELAGIVQLKKNDFFNNIFFPNTVPAYYWTSNERFYSTMWVMNFDNGSADISLTSSSNNIRAVRGGHKKIEDNFIINGDGTVTDLNTGLMWQRGYSYFEWDTALSYCESLTLAGYSDWRMPNREELRTILNYSSTSTLYNEYIFYFPGPPKPPFLDYFWTSSAYDKEEQTAWAIFMDFGKAVISNWSNEYFVLALRQGQQVKKDKLEILSPVQTSQWNAGDKMPIIWDTAGLSGNVGIAISREGGKEGTFTKIVNTTENDGYYEWTVSGASVNCVLQIISWEDSSQQTEVGLFFINDIQTGIILDFPFDGDILDSSGYLNHGENHGISFVNDRLERPNNACFFDGQSTYIDVERLSNDINPLKSLSYSFWLKPDASSINKSQDLFSITLDNNKSPQINIKLIDQKITYACYNLEGKFDYNNTYYYYKEGQHSQKQGPIVEPDQWSFITITINDMTGKIFLNGQESLVFGAVGPGYYVHENSISKISISSPNAPYNGLIDDFRIYNRPLSDKEVEQLYEMKHFSVSSDYHYLPSSSGAFDITVYSNIIDNNGNMTYSLNVSNSNWLTTAAWPSVPFQTKSAIHIFFAENTGAERNASIILNASQAPLTIDIFQEAANIEIQEPENLQDIINNANDGSVIKLDDGNYKLGEVQILNKQIEIQSKNGPKNCILHGKFIIENKSSNLSGLTIISENQDSAIQIKTSNSLIHNCILSNGGIISESSSISIVNTLITNSIGNGIQCTDSTLNIIHSTIAENPGKGIDAQNSTIEIHNSIIWANLQGSIQATGNVMVSHSNISGGFEGDANINQDPLFINSAENNFHLKEDSPCIDSGKLLDAMPFSDLENEPRPKPAGSLPDMGAYENPNGKKDLYVAFPPDEQSFCPAPDAFMNIMWDASQGFQFYRFSLYKDQMNPGNQVTQDWCKRSQISISYNDLSHDQQYVWSVEPFPATAEASMITGQFRILSEKDCFNQSENQKFLAASFLIGYLVTYQDIKSIRISGGSGKDAQVHSGSKDWFKYFGTGFIGKSVKERYVHFPGVKPFHVTLPPYWIRVIVYDDYQKRWRIWL